MISISTITQNMSGNIDLEEHPKTNLYDSSARVTRTATLDGGALLVHSGFSNSDQTFKIYGDITAGQEQVLRNIFETQALVYLSCSIGYFSGTIERLKIDSGDLTLVFLVKEKLSA